MVHPRAAFKGWDQFSCIGDGRYGDEGNSALGIITDYAHLSPDPDDYLPIRAKCAGEVKYEPGTDDARGTAALRSLVRAGEPIMTIVGSEIEALKAAYLRCSHVADLDSLAAAKLALNEIGMSNEQIKLLVKRYRPSPYLTLRLPFNVAVDHVLPGGAPFKAGDRLYSFARWERRIFRLRLPRRVADSLDLLQRARVMPTKWKGDPLDGYVAGKNEVGDGEQVWVNLKLARRPKFPDDEWCRIEIHAPRLAQDYPPPVVQVVSQVDPGYRGRWGLTAEDREAMKQRGGRGGISARPEYKREQALQAAEQEERRRTRPPLAHMKPASKSKLGDTGLPRVELSEVEWKEAGIRTTKRRRCAVTPEVTADVWLSHDASALQLDPAFAASAAKTLTAEEAGAGEAAAAAPVLFAYCLLSRAAADAMASGGWLELAFTPATGERFRGRGPMFAACCEIDGERRVRFGLALPASALHIEGKRKVLGAVLADPDGAREVLAVPRSCVRRWPDQAEDGPDRVIAVHAGERQLAPVRVRVGIEGGDLIEIESGVPLPADEAIVYDLGAIQDAVYRFREGQKRAAGAADWQRYRANLNRKDRKP